VTPSSAWLAGILGTSWRSQRRLKNQLRAKMAACEKNNGIDLSRAHEEQASGRRHASVSSSKISKNDNLVTKLTMTKKMLKA